MTMTLRIYADFNSGGSPGDGPCWLLRYGPDHRPLDDVANELGLKDGMTVTLYYKEEYEGMIEDFEVTAVLIEEKNPNSVRWQALPDWKTYKLNR